MDKAGTAVDPNQSMVSSNASMMHQQKWDESVKRFGMKKRDKTGGARMMNVPDFR